MSKAMDILTILESSSFCYAKSKNKENQDSILPLKLIDNGALFCIADGVGSYEGSRYASKSAVSFLGALDSSSSIKNIPNIFHTIKNKITDISSINNEFSHAATTMTFGYFDLTGLHIGHIGDCRLYVLNDCKLKQLTKDHTQYQMLLDEGLFSKKQLQNKKEKAQSILTTAISQFTEMKFESTFIPLEELPQNNGVISLYIMSDGAYHFWEKRPKFSHNTMKSTINFTSSLKRRIERTGPIDDYSMVALSIKIPSE